MPCAMGGGPQPVAPPPAAPPIPPQDSAALIQALTAVVDVLGALAQALAAGAPAGTAPTVPAAQGAGVTAGGGSAGSVSQTPVQSPIQSPAQVSPTTPTQRGAGGRSTARVASFNVLGQSHTTAGGSKPHGWKSGTQRVPGMIAALRRHDVEIAGLQEFQEPQQRAFRAANTGYELHGERDNVIAWRADRYRKVGATSLTIPYFKGQPRRMPAVQLEDRQTGARVWVLNIHNPADVRGMRNEPHRREAERRERALVARLEATGVPVIVTGDFNDRTDSVDAMTGGGLMNVAPSSAANGSIDWVFGTRGVDFSQAVRDTSPSRERTSDHPIVVSNATF